MVYKCEDTGKRIVNKIDSGRVMVWKVGRLYKRWKNHPKMTPFVSLDAEKNSDVV